MSANGTRSTPSAASGGHSAAPPAPPTAQLVGASGSGRLGEDAPGLQTPGPGPRPAWPATALRTPARFRRRPAMLAAGVALVAVGGLAAAYVTQLVSSTAAVVAVARPVLAGAVLSRADLTVAHVNSDPALRPVPASELLSLVGQRAATDLPAGSLLTAVAVAPKLVPAAGQSLVGVALKTEQRPAELLRPGDQVRLVDTPTGQTGSPGGAVASIPAVVVSLAGPDDSGLEVVDVTVPTGRAAEVAALVVTGRVVLVLDSREH